MLVSDAITRVRAMVGDVDALQFTDAQLIAWINDGIRECAITNNLLQKRATQNSIVGTSSYALPSDILKLHSIKYDGVKLRGVTLEEYDQWYTGVDPTEQGVPEISLVWAGTLTLYPTPSEVKQIIIDYIYDPAQHTIGALGVELNLPISYHPRVIDYCLAQVAQQDDDMNRYATKMQEFKTGIRELSDQGEYTQDLYPSMSISERDAGDGMDWY